MMTSKEHSPNVWQCSKYESAIKALSSQTGKQSLPVFKLHLSKSLITFVIRDVPISYHIRLDIFLHAWKIIGPHRTVQIADLRWVQPFLRLYLEETRTLL